jgi:signal transduction histidine kinase
MAAPQLSGYYAHVRASSAPHQRSTSKSLAAQLSPLLRTRWSGYFFALIAVGFASALIGGPLTWASMQTASILFVLPVLVTAALYGRGPALLAAGTAFLAFDWNDIPPIGAFAFNDPQELLSAGVFLITALVAGQLAVTLRQVAVQSREHEREALALYEVARLVPGSSLELQPLLGLILEQLKTIVEYEAAAVVLRDEHGQTVVFDYRGPLPRERVVGLQVRPGSALGEIVEQLDRRREPLLAEDAEGSSPLARDLAAAGVPLPPQPTRHYSGLAVPLIVKGRVIGIETLLHSKPGSFTPRHAELAMIFAQQAAVAIENARLYSEIRERLNETLGLQRLSATLLQEHDIDRLLQEVCLELQSLVAAEGVALALLDESKCSFDVRTVVGPDAHEVVGAAVPVEGLFAGEAVRLNQPVRSDDAQHDPRGLQPRLVPRRTRTLLSVPMRTRLGVVGAVSIYNKRGAPSFTQRDADLAMLFAQQAAVAIENARLYEEARHVAALEERQRLARELHDSVSQALYGIVLNASTADEIFEVSPERVRGLLHDVLRLADAGMAELRALIFELRPETLEREGLVGALEKQAAAVRARHGLDVRMNVAGEPDLPHAAKEVLYRVAQEALNNAARHARAHTLDLELDVSAAEVGLMVADDGRGFDPLGEFPGHFGLQSMRERAAAVGGVVEIDSAPGGGTRLRARIPVTAQARGSNPVGDRDRNGA